MEYNDVLQMIGILEVKIELVTAAIEYGDDKAAFYHIERMVRFLSELKELVEKEQQEKEKAPEEPLNKAVEPNYLGIMEYIIHPRLEKALKGINIGRIDAAKHQIIEVLDLIEREVDKDAD